MSVRRPVAPTCPAALGAPMVRYEDRLRATMHSVPKPPVGALFKAEKSVKDEPPPMLQRSDAKEELTNPPLRKHPKWARLLRSGRDLRLYRRQQKHDHPLESVFEDILDYWYSLDPIYDNDTRTPKLKAQVQELKNKVRLAINEFKRREARDNFPNTYPRDFSDEVKAALLAIEMFTVYLEDEEEGPFSYSD